MTIPISVLETIARAAHEANRAYCIGIGDHSHPSWEYAPEWQRTSCIAGVPPVLAGATPQESHALWVKDKLAAGWSHGPVKDPVTKRHPCIVAYDQLPEDQRAKDVIYGAVVRAMAQALKVCP